MSRIARLITILPLALSVVVLATTPAAASCMLDERPLAEQIATHEGPVFIGTVTITRNNGRSAEFEVTEVWKGEPGGATVIVHGGPKEGNMATSVDRTFEDGQAYLVAAIVDGAGDLTDNACSPTRFVDDEVEAARPDTVTAPPADTGSPNATDDDTGSSLAPAVALAVVVLASLVMLGAIALRGRRTSDDLGDVVATDPPPSGDG